MTAPRFVVVDENIHGLGGHYLELASVILREAAARGYRPQLWAGGSFSPPQAPACPWQVRPTFGCTKMRRWSLGVDGHSRWRRGDDGRVIGVRQPWRSLVRFAEACSPHPPAAMHTAWCTDFGRALDEMAPRPDDRILLSTADDFTLSALASTLATRPLAAPLRLDVLFHLSLLPGRPGQPGGHAISRQFAAQIDHSLDRLHPHRVRLWATTAELADQLNHACGRNLWTAINYPIRGDFFDAGQRRCQTDVPRRRMLLGGGVRTEKGKHSIRAVIETLWPEFLQTGRWQLAMQLPKNAKAERLLPPKLRGAMPWFRTAGLATPLRLADGILDDSAYTRWMTSADVGLFLYDGGRYFARCSGVLVELLSAGVPVIVPAASWLSRQISPRMYEHLDGFAATAASGCGEIVRSGGSLSVQWPRQHDALLLGFPHPRAAGDCVAVTSQPFDADGRPLEAADRWILDERCDGVVRVLVKRTRGAAVTQIAYGPAFAHGATVEDPQTSWPRDGAELPESAVGLVAAGPDQLTRLLRELDRHQQHYQQTAAAHASRWTHQHSAAAFLDILQVPPVPVVSQITAAA